MTAYYKEITLKTRRDVYEPKEDSFLLADNLKVEKGGRVLDMGTGTGIQAIIASKDASDVLAVDINPNAIETARENAKTNKAENIRFLESDLFEKIKATEKFDLMIFNPPYVPSEEKDMAGRAWAGGVNGREVIERFIEEASGYLYKGGWIQLLVSSLNDVGGVRRKLTSFGFASEITASKKLWFEELYVLTSRKQEKNH